MATNYSTPNVYLQETDLSEITIPVGNSTGAIVIDSDRGPVNRRILVTSDKDFLDTFGIPDGSTFGHYAALEFLKESNTLYVVRSTLGNGSEKYSNICVGATSGVTSAADIVATSSATVLTGAYADGDKYNNIYSIETLTLPASTFLAFSSIGPGTYGNNIGIRITTSADTPVISGGNFDWKNKYDNDPSFDTDPLWKKVFKVEVFEKDTKSISFSSTLNPLEIFYVTRDNNVDGNGKQLQIEKVINGVSKYIYVKNSAATSPGVLPVSMQTITGLTKGTNATAVVSQGSLQACWNLFKDVNKIKVNILLCPEEPSSASVKATQVVVGNIASKRQDCIAVVQANPYTYQDIPTLVNNTEFGYSNGSYVSIYAGYSRVYDRFNDKFIMIPNAIFGATLMARTDNVANTWDAPAGINRGILNVQDQDVVYTDDEIGVLYDNNINVVKKIDGIGFIMWGQKTAQKKKSALDRINVRRLLIFLENTIRPTLLPFLFEGNTESNRLRISTINNSFLNTVKSSGGLNKFSVVCDDTNNTPQVIDSYTIILDIYVMPTKVAEYIKLNVIITKTGVSLTEV